MLVIVGVKEGETVIDADMEGDRDADELTVEERVGVAVDILLVVGVVEGVRVGLGIGGS